MANIENVSFSSLVRSGAIPASHVNPIQRAFDKLNEAPKTSKAQEFTKLGIAFGETIRATGVGGVTGMLLGAVQGALPGGLDIKVPFLKTKHTVPGDLWASLAGGAISVATANHESGLSPIAREGAAVCMGIFTFRTTNDAIVKLRQAKSGVTPGGGAAPVPGKIGKAEFAGDLPGVRTGWGAGFLSRGQASSDVENDPIVKAAGKRF